MESIRKDITFLNFDQTLTEQKSLHKYPHHWIDMTDIFHTNGYCENESLDNIRRRLHADTSKLHFIGNGNYHYVSYLLLEKIKVPFSLVLFDHHADMMDSSDTILSCGSWVSYAINNLPMLRKVLIIGVNETDYTSITSKFPTNKIHLIYEGKIQKSPLNKLVNEARQFLHNEKSIYISVDKDVLYKSESMTNWDHGTMSLVQLLYLFEELQKSFSIIGMDVCGEYTVNYSNQYELSVIENIKKNEIVNWSITEFARENHIIMDEGRLRMIN